MGPEDLYIFAGSSNEHLALKICTHLDVPLRKTNIERFSHGTLSIQLGESVRNKDVYIIQSHTNPVHRHIMQMLMMIDIARHGDARRVTAVIPYYVYGRSDKKDAPRICITGKLVAKLIEAAGADRVIAVSLHSPQTHGFFDVPLDHLTGQHVLIDYFKKQDLSDTIVVSPDVGYAKQATKLAYALGLPVAVGTKMRLSDKNVEIKTVLGVGTSAPRRAIVIDDEIATGGTMVEIVRVLRKLGTQSFTLAATHGLFTGNAISRLNHLHGIEQIVCTDTVYSPHAWERIHRLTVVPVASAIGDAILCNHDGRSVGALFAYWEGDSPSDQMWG